jgi:ABC-type multidrug transport system permease subunit
MNPPETQRRYWPLGQMIACRMREFSREPEAWIWTYAFPILMTVALGIAFRNQKVPEIAVDVIDNPQAQTTQAALATTNETQAFKVKIVSAEEAHSRLRSGKTDVVVTSSLVDGQPHYEYQFDSTRAQSVQAKSGVNDQLQRAAGRKDIAAIESVPVDEAGSRYIDFLVPGLLGIDLLGGGMWGVGFVIVDMRIRHLLKRFLATPMERWEFLIAVMSARFIFTMLQAFLLLVFARYAFGVVNHGSYFTLVLLMVLGGMMFFGLGLLVASRVKTQDAIFGLMNLVQLPMWILSGIFFSSERFPEVVQPVIKALPLTPLIDSMRAVMLEGADLVSQLPRMGIMAAWGIGGFVVALKIFRWR